VSSAEQLCYRRTSRVPASRLYTASALQAPWTVGSLSASVQRPQVFRDGAYMCCTLRSSWVYHHRKLQLSRQKRRLRCGTHREDGMLHVSSICEVVGCLTTAGFQRSPGQKPTRCSAHREEGMMIFGKLCRQPGCKTIAHYGYAGSQKSFCKHHFKEGMIREPLVNPALWWRR
jgi:hypothetical protein